MCGIVGYSGTQPAAPILLNGLKRLEYRGYDSAGLALVSPEGIRVEKSQGKVANLVELLGDYAKEPSLGEATSGIAHTRWATHGPPTTVNAHPHAARPAGEEGNRVALVHNGIIENYKALKARLEAAGRTFLSETDTEVLAHLVDSYYEGNLVEAVTRALKEVEGTFGVASVAVDEPGVMVVARRGSPIVIGLGEDETLVASDAAAILRYTRQVIYLDDNDVARIEGPKVEIRSLDALPVTREATQIDWSDDAAEKGGYAHYMLKEIFEQPESIWNTIRGRMDADRGNAVLSGLNLNPRDLADLQRVLLVGCGTSLNAGLVGEYAIEEFAGLLAEVEQAAEFRYRNPIVGAKDLVLAISQSGETADTLAAVREAVDKGALVAGLVNVVGSTIARETGRGIYLHAGPEISVASTKAFTSQVSCLLMIALKFARAARMSRERGVQFVREIEAIPEQVRQVLALNDEIAEIAANYTSAENAFFIGRGFMYPVALEGALKLKEVSYIHAEAFHAAELKHGSIALLTEEVPVVALAPVGPGKDKTLSNVAECRARGSKVLLVATEGDEEVDDYGDHIIRIPAAPLHTAVIPAAVALQLFAYHVARLRDCAIDQPRNLAKSVTVE
ncbi:glutamine--fructose-6-phosphate transaminase (isomerizing) [Roseibacillus ishigakijimensis]|uniref:Glutamine--fructose-6-phosphate aminotransferase [isomerizing] n=1 Tax=Roseibacillus ishigakijimensis TaxID=454146 RepID=A0A934RNB9_9BACT|nr:glutamine--fructose-6-phosphate transaminase (isomerizing) [Roseibacillus ishigakijimensis]MBK1834554.1 glutamine--fructose-6-phosphate transaminase (isomerizing) [Roseibacillus ishigakijimensis]